MANCRALPKKILILGGLGYFGSRLALHWSSRQKVVVTCRRDLPGRTSWARSKGIKVATGDQLGPNASELKENFDLVVNLATPGAAECSRDADRAFCETQKTLNWCVNGLKSGNISRLLHFSSFHVYGRIQETYSELDIPDPKIPYGSIHFEGEKKLSIQAGEFPISVIRPSNLIGCPAHSELGEQSRLLALDLCQQSLKGAIKLNNDGQSHRDFLSFENAIRAVDLTVASQCNVFTVYNLASGRSIPIREIVETIKNSYQKKQQPLEIIIGSGTDLYRFPFEIQISRLAKLGWRPTQDMEPIIDSIIEFYKGFSN